MLFMESLSGVGKLNNSDSEEAAKALRKKDSVETFKIITLIFSGLTGLFAIGLFGQFWSLADPVYYALLFRIQVIGYVCISLAIINIVTSLIFKKDMIMFLSFSFLIAIFGSSQFIIFASSPFGVADKINNGIIGHYQYILSFVLGLLTLILVCLYIINSRKKK